MKNSMILELAYSNYYCSDKIKLYDNKEYQKNYNALFEICEELCKDMSDKEKREISNKVFDAHCGAEVVAADEHFKEGFKLGLIIGAQNFLE